MLIRPLQSAEQQIWAKTFKIIAKIYKASPYEPTREKKTADCEQSFLI